jgi:hypothetical protein
MTAGEVANPTAWSRTELAALGLTSLEVFRAPPLAATRWPDRHTPLRPRRPVGPIRSGAGRMQAMCGGPMWHQSQVPSVSASSVPPPVHSGPGSLLRPGSINSPGGTEPTMNLRRFEAPRGCVNGGTL